MNEAIALPAGHCIGWLRENLMSIRAQFGEVGVLGHTKLESTVRYFGIEVDDALEMAEQTSAQKFGA